MQIAVVGGGPAGSYASELLAHAGHDVTLFDAHGPWEKPCGGGVTARALSVRLLPHELDRQPIDRVTFYFGDRISVTCEPREPLVVVSRQDLGKCSLSAAEAAGARFVKGRVRQIRQDTRDWILETNEGDAYPAEFIVGADGATSFVRRSLGTPLTSADLHVTVGYFIPAETDSEMKIFFLPEMEGYIWSFPRRDHLSYGLITRADPGWTSRGKALLQNYIEADLGPEAMDEAEFYSAPVPALRAGSWKENQIQGDRWALIGDAAGLVDPITGEGIYYALRSAELLAEQSPRFDGYAETIQQECFEELERASQLYARFYRGGFLGGSFSQRMVQFARRSPTIRTVLGNLVAGTQPYIGLRRHLLRSVPRLTFDLIRSLGN